MKKIDVSILSIILIASLLATLVPQTVVRANNESDEIIEFKDANFKKYLKNRGMDRNNDGEITKGEMEQVTYLGLTYLDTYNIKNIDEMKYAKNVKELMISYFDLKSIDLTQFKNLEYFEYKCKDEKDAIKKENMNIPDNFFVYGQKPYYENSYVIKGYIKKDVTIYVNEYNGISLDHATFEQNGIIDYYKGGIIGLKEGTVKIKYEGNIKDKEITVTVKNSDLNSDPELKNTGLTAKLVEDLDSQDKILQSNGNLWSFDNKSNMELEDTKVKDVVSIYGRNNSSYMGYYLKLKDDNTLNIVKTDKDEQKQIKDVKQIVQGVGCSYSAYLTTDNKLYYVDPTAAGDSVYRKVDEQVEKVMGSYYIKGGKTYFVNGQKVLDSEISGARGTFCVAGNTLYTFDITQNQFLQIDTEFKEFSYDEAQERSKVRTVYVTKNGEQKQAYYKSNAPGPNYIQGRESYTYRPDGDNYYSIRLTEDNTLYMEKELLLLTNVYFTQRYLNEEENGFIVAVRTDGTIWINSLDNVKKFSKVEKESEEEKKGDIDGDGEISSFDAYKALEISLSSEELTENQIKLLDIDKDGSVTAYDAYLILSYSVGIIDENFWGTSNSTYNTTSSGKNSYTGM